ncbi:hypothetical protein NPIL_371421 [Nephila pilipes]|uniref:Uncharacterized protein n=1 Tax=Nephila pilipes TaxID=299642 RepID=A0A8X6PB16_NEPPI|nr:hypothetical protein NPIL_371421 [Nephila pilipes]
MFCISRNSKRKRRIYQRAAVVCCRYRSGGFATVSCMKYRRAAGGGVPCCRVCAAAVKCAGGVAVFTPVRKCWRMQMFAFACGVVVRCKLPAVFHGAQNSPRVVSSA